MDDFLERFLEIFQRIVNCKWPGARVEAERVVGRWPINEAGSSHERWKDKAFVLVRVFYAADYFKDDAEKRLDGALFQECMSALIAMGLGPLLHHSDVFSDHFRIFAMEEQAVYERLPSLGMMGE